MNSVPAIQRVVAFRNLNRALDMLECAYDMIDTVKLLHPNMDVKYYDKLYRMASAIRESLPIDPPVEDPDKKCCGNHRI